MNLGDDQRARTIDDNPYQTMPRQSRRIGHDTGDVEHIDLREESMGGAQGPGSIAGGLRMQNLTRDPNARRYDVASREDRVTVLS